MSLTHFILAAAKEDDFSKVIAGAAFFIIWVVSSLVSAANKKKEKLRRAGVQTPVVSAPAAQAARVLRTQSTSVVKPAVSKRKAPQLPKQPRRTLPTAPPPVPRKSELSQLFTTGLSASTRPIEASEIGAMSASARVNRGAQRLRNALTANALRQQFLITEVLRPPISMRPEAEGMD